MIVLLAAFLDVHSGVPSATFAPSAFCVLPYFPAAAVAITLLHCPSGGFVLSVFNIDFSCLFFSFVYFNF